LNSSHKCSFFDPFFVQALNNASAECCEKTGAVIVYEKMAENVTNELEEAGGGVVLKKGWTAAD